MLHSYILILIVLIWNSVPIHKCPWILFTRRAQMIMISINMTQMRNCWQRSSLERAIMKSLWEALFCISKVCSLKLVHRNFFSRHSWTPPSLWITLAQMICRKPKLCNMLTTLIRLATMTLMRMCILALSKIYRKQFENGNPTPCMQISSLRQNRVISSRGKTI